MYLTVHYDPAKSSDSLRNFIQNIRAGGISDSRGCFGHPDEPIVHVNQYFPEIKILVDYDESRKLPFKVSQNGSGLKLFLKHITPLKVLDDLGNPVDWEIMNSQR